MAVVVRAGDRMGGGDDGWSERAGVRCVRRESSSETCLLEGTLQIRVYCPQEEPRRTWVSTSRFDFGLGTPHALAGDVKGAFLFCRIPARSKR